MNKTMILNIWRNLHPVVHFWMVISVVCVLSLYGLMSWV